MHILYVSLVCSSAAMEGLIAAGYKPAIQAQRFHRMMLQGFARCLPSGSVTAISILPAPAGSWFGRRIGGYSETEAGVSFLYIPLRQLPFIRRAGMFLRTAKAVSSLCRGEGEAAETCVIVDALTPSAALAARMASRLCGKPCIALVTDAPLAMHRMAFARPSLRSVPSFFINAARQASLRVYDGFVFLTEAMNGPLNARKRPHLVVEGLVEEDSPPRADGSSQSSERTVLMYAGGVNRFNGIDRLLSAFSGMRDDGLELWLFGGGDLEERAKEQALTDPRIRFFGLVTNGKILEAERNADLLINPRPTSREFTKYSFPSKNMEFMCSGTPLLTTRLAGIPADHFPYLYFIDDDSIDGLRKAITKVLNVPAEERMKMGKMARNFVLLNKNNVRTAQRILDFLAANYPKSAPGTRK